MRTRYFVGGFLLPLVVAVMLLPGQTETPVPLIYATLQKPGAPRGYVTGSLKTDLEGAAGFFIVAGEVVRLGNVDYRIAENPDTTKDNKTYSLQDSKGRFLVCCDNGAVSVSATPADNAQWFRIRFYTPAQKLEIENRRSASQNKRGP